MSDADEKWYGECLMEIRTWDRDFDDVTNCLDRILWELRHAGWKDPEEVREAIYDAQVEP